MNEMDIIDRWIRLFEKPGNIPTIEFSAAVARLNAAIAKQMQKRPTSVK